MNNQKIDPPLSERELTGAEISKRAAKEGMVLLKNQNHALPLTPGVIALFGNGAARTVRGGTGSGDPFNGGLSGGGDANVDLSPRYHIQVLPALQRAGFTVLTEQSLIAWGEKYDEAYQNLEDRVMITFSFPEEELAEDAIREYASQTDTAVYVLSRNSGEGNDRKVEDDFDLSATEKQNLALVRQYFSKLILVLNVGGPLSVKDLREADPDAMLLMSQPGQEAGDALAEILTGETSPSGKLTTTWGLTYPDYPSAGTYLSDWDTSLYTEGIYVGYRYFRTFGVETGFPFGYGLSYTEFKTEPLSAGIKENVLAVTLRITNTGTAAGREVAQLYVSAPSTVLDMPYQELRGFQKTRLLEPNEAEELTIRVPVSDLASYSEVKGGYLLSRGYYIVRIGTSSEETTAVAAICVEETVKTVLVDPVMPLRQPLEELTGPMGNDNKEEAAGLPVLVLDKPVCCEDRRSKLEQELVETYTTDETYQPVLPYERVVLVEKKTCSFEDLLAGRVSPQELIAQCSDEELVSLVCGTGWGVTDDANPVIGASSESVPGAAGETTHILEDTMGVPSMVLADGPGGVRLTQCFEATNLETGEKQQVYHYCIAWPIGTLIAQSFDLGLAKELGEAMNADLRAMGIEVLLGPGVNIHRNPLCGRNFEYFSEDPLLAGEMAVAITLGIQKDDTAAACVKHYALNNQETNRNANNSVAGQRAMRELYLEPFRLAVTKGKVMTLMTSYNKINGVPTADSYDLCTNLARGEWGFDGLIMTDWNGGSSTPSLSMHAGNDLIMPGGFEKGRIIHNAMKKCLPKHETDGKTTVCGGEDPFVQTICRGDVQRCALGVLNVIQRLSRKK